MTDWKRALRPVRARMRLERMLRAGMIGLATGAAVALLLRAASFWLPMPMAHGWMLGAVLILPLVSGAVACLWRVTDMDAARRADRLHLQARAQTALMLEGSDAPMALLQREDTLRALQSLNVRNDMPLRVPKWGALVALGCAMVLGASLFLPNPQTAVLAARAAFQQEMSKQAALVDEGTAVIDAEDEQTPELRRVLGELARELRTAQDVTTALEAVDEAERGLQTLRREASEQAMSALAQSGLQALASALEAGDEAAVREALEAAGEDAIAQAIRQADSQGISQALQEALAQMKAQNASQAAQTLMQLTSGQTAAITQAQALAQMARAAAAQAGARQAAALGQNGSQAAQLMRSGGTAGTGTSHADAGITSASSQAAGQRDPAFRQSEYERIYDPTRLGADGEITYEKGQLGEGDIAQAAIGDGLGVVEGSVPDESAWTEYRQTAVEAAQTAVLPAFAREWVERYFDALGE